MHNSYAPAYRPTSLDYVLPVLKELITGGYETLRFMSYIKEGIALRVFIYCEAQGPTSEQRIATQVWSCSYRHFNQSTYPSKFDSWVAQGASVEECASFFKDEYLSGIERTESSQACVYLAWLTEVIVKCPEQAFPITEEPMRSGFGENGEYLKFVFKDMDRAEAGHGLMLKRPPGFESTQYMQR